MWKEWGKVVCTRTSKKKKKETRSSVHKVDIDVKDDVPIVDVLIDNIVISNAYIDGGASINVMSKKMLKDVGLIYSNTSSPYRIKLADNTRVKTLGVVRGLDVDVCGISAPTTFQVIPTKPGSKAYPLILGRPWLRKVKAVQKWDTGELILQDKDKRVRYNIRSQEKEFLKESSMATNSSSSDLIDEDDEDEEETEYTSKDLSEGEEVKGMAFGVFLGVDMEVNEAVGEEDDVEHNK